MYVTYDSDADAAYIKLIPGRHKVVVLVVDDDIALNMDEHDRLIGIEILDASKRLDLKHLLPLGFGTPHSEPPDYKGEFSDEGQPNWNNLAHALIKLQKLDQPVLTSVKEGKNWVVEVANDYIVVRRDGTDNLCKITREEFEHGTPESLRKKHKWAITRALRDYAATKE
jgi:uncharacterized protein YuzE